MVADRVDQSALGTLFLKVKRYINRESNSNLFIFLPSFKALSVERIEFRSDFYSF